ncbi:hypothetical protein H5395_18290 [Paracoccus sp. MC1854]|uniref:3'-5' exonuclease n=1 Tax=Paracoccus sp. MC1854 TaxID=2760306 RepID=UPI001601040C|nr:hypothetical protein [Paracoccus sp. MC1854]
MAPAKIAVLLRSGREVPRASAAVEIAGNQEISVRLMHDAKGQEYRAVVVMTCDADVLPDEGRLQSASDERAHREVYETERHLLYVAETRPENGCGFRFMTLRRSSLKIFSDFRSAVHSAAPNSENSLLDVLGRYGAATKWYACGEKICCT